MVQYFLSFRPLLVSVQFFTERVISICNYLPDSINFTSFSRFMCAIQGKNFATYPRYWTDAASVSCHCNFASD